MSLDATRWAWQQQLRASAKLVLLSLADRADENHRCYPSITRLKSDTGLHSETISDAIKELESLRLIAVQRVTGQGNVYRLLGVENRHHHPGKAGYPEKPGYPEKAGGTTPEKQGTTTPENRGMNLSVEPIKNLPSNLSGKTPDAAPPNSEKQKPKKRDNIDLAALPDSLSQDVWADFVKHRKAKKAPLTQTAVNRIASELATAMQAGWTADAALAEAMAAGWTGVKAEWLQNRVGTQRAPPAGNPQADNKPLVKPFPQRARS